MQQFKLFLFLALFTVFLTSNSVAQNANPRGLIEIDTDKGPVRFSVEYAITQAQKAKGLMFRKSLPNKHGMFFIYQTPRDVTMWMKDTPMSLDMFFITKRGNIRKIAINTEPESLKQIVSGGKVSAVLELRAGSAEDYGIKVGDKVKIIK